MRSIKQAVPKRARPILLRSLFKIRLATARYRCLPDFIILGAQKAGTSSLYYYLSQHPDLLPSFVKEVHYFDGGIDPDVDTYSKGLDWYRAHFPLKARIRPHQKTFEASPLYLFNPLAPKRIAEALPNVKMVALLRNPTTRAVSHYFHETRRGQEHLPMRSALEAEEARLEPVLRTNQYKSHAFIHHTYKRRGIYVEQVRRYYDNFPKDRLLLLSSEAFFQDPQTALRLAFAFLGVDPSFRPRDMQARNAAADRTRADSDVYEYLDAYFREHNQDLFDILGGSYGWQRACASQEHPA